MAYKKSPILKGLVPMVLKTVQGSTKSSKFTTSTSKQTKVNIPVRKYNTSAVRSSTASEELRSRFVTFLVLPTDKGYILKIHFKTGEPFQGVVAALVTDEATGTGGIQAFYTTGNSQGKDWFYWLDAGVTKIPVRLTFEGGEVEYFLLLPTHTADSMQSLTSSGLASYSTPNSSFLSTYTAHSAGINFGVTSSIIMWLENQCHWDDELVLEDSPTFTNNAEGSAIYSFNSYFNTAIPNWWSIASLSSMRLEPFTTYGNGTTIVNGANGSDPFYNLNLLITYVGSSYPGSSAGFTLYSFNSSNLNTHYQDVYPVDDQFKIHPANEEQDSNLWGHFRSSASATEFLGIESTIGGSNALLPAAMAYFYARSLPGAAETNYYVCTDETALNYWQDSGVYFDLSSDGTYNQVPVPFTAAEIQAIDSGQLVPVNQALCTYCGDLALPYTGSAITTPPTSCNIFNGSIEIKVEGVAPGTTFTITLQNNFGGTLSQASVTSIAGEYTTHTFTGLEGGSYQYNVSYVDPCGDTITHNEIVELNCDEVSPTSYCSQTNALNTFTPGTLGDAGLVVGAYFEGGIVFYVGSDYALVAAMDDVILEIPVGGYNSDNSDIETVSEVVWSAGCSGAANTECNTTFATGTILGTDVGLGQSNTSDITTNCDDIWPGSCNTISAAMASNAFTITDINEQVRGDWYLPSKDELALLSNVLHITTEDFIYPVSGTTVTRAAALNLDQGEFYWSSSEVNSSRAYTLYVNPVGVTASMASKDKSQAFRVRPIRKISISNSYTIDDSLCVYCNTLDGTYINNNGGVVSQDFGAFNNTIQNSSLDASGNDLSTGSANISFTPFNYEGGTSAESFSYPADFTNSSNIPTGANWVISYKLLTTAAHTTLTNSYGTNTTEWWANNSSHELLNSLTTVNLLSQTVSTFIEGLEVGVYFIKVHYNVASVEDPIEGCFHTDWFEINLPGCTDPLSSSYNPIATDDDGSCVYNLNLDISDYLVFQVINVNIPNTPDACQFMQVVQFMVVGLDVGINNYDQWVNLSENLDEPLNLNAAIRFIIANIPGNSNLVDPENTIWVQLHNIAWSYYTANETNTNVITISDTSASGDAGILLNNGGHRQVITFPALAINQAGAVGINQWIISMHIAYYPNGFSNGGESFSETAAMFDEYPLTTTWTEAFFDSGICANCAIIDDIVYGCTDPLACNYDADANMLDPENPCQTSADICGCTNTNYLEYWNSAGWSLGGTESNPLFDNNSVPPGEIAHPNIEDGSCSTLAVMGCFDPSYLQYNPDANVSDPTMCIDPIIYGCTDPTACNYNTVANTSDGSCFYQTDFQESCEEFSGWSISDSSIAPTNCGEDATYDGVIVLVNPNYSGPFQLIIYDADGDFMGAAEPIWSDGSSEYTGNFDTEQNSEASQEGVTESHLSYTIGQDSSGTNVTISGLNTGIYTFTILQLGDPAIDDTQTCVCSVGASDITASSTGTQLAWVLEEEIYTTSADSSGRQFFRVALSGDAADCGCTDVNSGGYVVASPATTDDGTCTVYGCTDPTATNYNASATLLCTDPENQLGAPYGAAVAQTEFQPCQPCVYGYVSTMYTPQFCMPKQLSSQLTVLRNCVATAGTKSYINTISGQEDKEFREAWKLLLVEYLLSKEGLDCLYNCATDGTKNFDAIPTCTSSHVYKGRFINNVGPEGSVITTINSFIVYKIGDTILYSRDALGSPRYYKLVKLPFPHPYLPDASAHLASGGGFKVFIESFNAAQFPEVNSTNILNSFSPTHPYGSTLWKLCEAPPKMPHNEDYLGKFLKFAETYCRTCTMSPKKLSAGSLSTSSVLSVGGIVISVNNNNFE